MLRKPSLSQFSNIKNMEEIITWFKSMVIKFGHHFYVNSWFFSVILANEFPIYHRLYLLNFFFFCELCNSDFWHIDSTDHVCYKLKPITPFILFQKNIIFFIIISIYQTKRIIIKLYPITPKSLIADLMAEIGGDMYNYTIV